MKSIDQGTILYGFCSKKYPEVPNYAVIISARCDIANKKISKLYYLTAIDAHQWFCTSHGFQCAMNQYISSCRSSLESLIGKYGLNVGLLESFNKADGLSVINEKVTGKDLKKAVDKYEELYRLVDPDSDFESRKKLFRNLDNDKKVKYVTQFLSNISSGQQHHYHFLPKSAYTDSTDMASGLIVDLQEIGILSFENASKIYSPGIDFQNIDTITKSHEELEDMKRLFWLKTEDDFVYEEGELKSPWRELLLQRFALDFIRIGVDGSTKSDYDTLALTIGKDS